MFNQSKRMGSATIAPTATKDALLEDGSERLAEVVLVAVAMTPATLDGIGANAETVNTAPLTSVTVIPEGPLNAAVGAEMDGLATIPEGDGMAPLAGTATAVAPALLAKLIVPQPLGCPFPLGLPQMPALHTRPASQLPSE